MGPFPPVPIAVLLGGKIDVSLPPGVEFPAFVPYMRAAAAQRLEHFSRITTGAINGLLLLVGRSGHFIQTTEPDTVIWAIRRVLAPRRP